MCNFTNILSPPVQFANPTCASDFNASQTGLRTYKHVLRKKRHDADLREISADAKYCQEVDENTSEVSKLDKMFNFTSYLATRVLFADLMWQESNPKLDVSKLVLP